MIAALEFVSLNLIGGHRKPIPSYRVTVAMSNAIRISRKRRRHAGFRTSLTGETTKNLQGTTIGRRWQIQRRRRCKSSLRVNRCEFSTRDEVGWPSAATTRSTQYIAGLSPTRTCPCSPWPTLGPAGPFATDNHQLRASPSRVPMKQRKASSGVHTMGSPRTLKLVLTSTEQPVRRLKAERSAW